MTASWHRVDWMADVQAPTLITPEWGRRRTPTIEEPRTDIEPRGTKPESVHHRPSWMLWLVLALAAVVTIGVLTSIGLGSTCDQQDAVVEYPDRPLGFEEVSIEREAVRRGELVGGMYVWTVKDEDGEIAAVVCAPTTDDPAPCVVVAEAPSGSLQYWYGKGSLRYSRKFGSWWSAWRNRG